MRKGFAERFALFTLDGQQTTRMSTEKSATLRSIAVAYEIERILEGRNLDISDIPEIEREARKASKDTDRKAFEKEFSETECKKGLLDIVPSLLGCDIEYYTAGVDIYEYRADETVYSQMLEALRRAILVPGEMTEVAFIALWLMRECVLYKLIDPREEETIEKNAEAFMKDSEAYRKLWDIKFRNSVEHATANLIRKKKIFMKKKFMQGVALFANNVQKEDSIFIDFVVLGTDPSHRRTLLKKFIEERGHHVEEVAYEGQALLKIDNRYYHVMPGSKQYRIPVQGAYIVPFYNAID